METTIRRPGVMVYFGTIRPCLKLLNKTEQLQLFDAILDYAEFGDVPDFGGTLGRSGASSRCSWTGTLRRMPGRFGGGKRPMTRIPTRNETEHP